MPRDARGRPPAPLQRGRAQLSAEVHLKRLDFGVLALLQRGRAQLSAEVVAVGGGGFHRDAASTGPRSIERGGRGDVGTLAGVGTSFNGAALN